LGVSFSVYSKIFTFCINDKNSPKKNRFWKLRKVCDILNFRFSEVYPYTEHLSTDEINVFFKGKVVLRQDISYTGA
jgi:hypothetical protein